MDREQCEEGPGRPPVTTIIEDSSLSSGESLTDIKTRAECRAVLFNLFVIAEPLMYFRVCDGTPTNKNLEIKYFVTAIQKIIKHFNK